MPHTRATVLIVDDQPTNIHALASLLKEDYRILTATRGEKALELAQAEQGPDLILMDIVMPDMDGYEICRRLKDNEATRAIPVIFVTALDHEKDEEEGLNLGAADYISKPFSPAVVRARVRNQVNLKLKTDLLEKISLQDGLTEIHNRRYFDQKLAEEWSRLSRNDQCLSLLMIDIDQFKPYNDHYGHGAGDDCLRRVAQALERVPVRAMDLVARYGGEEFVVLLPETDAQGARHVAKGMIEAINSLGIAHEYSDVAPHITISAGGATHSTQHPKASAEDLKEAADTALYQAKKNGRNQYRADT
ncbi:MULTISPECIES: diguanylate cyclase domain-containing protein [Ectothiorhodospira]|uniref:diguanylate cyclase domain-containing protein n=1 Tax=Ectothiorhodospira TaxID=1051 RepID=UPI00047DD3F0|nr:diguanylate cyclase [Ectothiorhodospira haloalkaliphila]MCG5494937.1 diguanylate cyclase [Ectothiorhodospira variabilis]MCG5504450.1 diguanylate cyclase [Ectothiorhodospira variabilis]MCG5507684.1 diguanylate cyclase [Ectothiorhodospira variabilis]